MFFNIQELTKSQEPIQTHIETHFLYMWTDWNKEEHKCTIETPRNTIKTTRTKN